MPNTTPFISVIIPAYNQERYIQQAIDSVLAQTYPRQEIIVVNDGSTDATATVVGNYGSQVTIINQENRGLAGARNSGIRAARGAFVGLLDADDTWEPHFLEKMTGLIATHPRATVFYATAQCVDENGSTLPQQVGYSTLPTDTPEAMHRAMLKANFLIPSTIVLNRPAVVEAGLFDEALQAIGVEDWDLWLRLLPTHSFVGTRKTLTNYRIHHKSLSANPTGMHNSMREVVEKHYGKDDGVYAGWSREKQIAYGGLYRNMLVTTIQRYADWQSCPRYLALAISSDAELTTDLDLFYDLALGSQPFGQRGTPNQLDLAANSQYIETLLADVFANQKLASLKKTTYGTAYYALGLVAYNTNQRNQCRAFLGRALSLRPGLWRTPSVFATWAKSFLSADLVGRLRSKTS